MRKGGLEEGEGRGECRCAHSLCRIFPGDKLEQTHNIFQQYQDPCRVGPRQDKPWAIGTCLAGPVPSAACCPLCLSSTEPGPHLGLQINI